MQEGEIRGAAEKRKGRKAPQKMKKETEGELCAFHISLYSSIIAIVFRNFDMYSFPWSPHKMQMKCDYIAHSGRCADKK